MTVATTLLLMLLFVGVNTASTGEADAGDTGTSTVNAVSVTSNNGDSAEQTLNVAKIGTTEYATLEAAWNAALSANADTTIDLTSNASGNGLQIADGSTYNHKITLNLNGYTYTFTGGAVGSSGTMNQAFHLNGAAGSAVIINGGKLVISSEATGILRFCMNYMDFTLNGVIIDMTSVASTLKGGISSCEDTLTITGNTQILMGSGYKAVINNMFGSHTDSNIVFDDNFTGKVCGDICLWNEGNAAEGAKGKIEIKAGTFLGEIGKAHTGYNPDHIENGTITVTVSGGTFADIAGAVKYATSVAKIVLADDVTIDGSIILDNGKNITIDLNGKTISFEKDQNFKVYQATLTLEGTGTVKEITASYAPIRMYGSTDSTATNYSVVTVGENVTLSGWAGVFLCFEGTTEKNYGSVLNFNGEIEFRKDGNYKGHGIYINGNITDPTNCAIINIGSTARISGDVGHAIYAAGYAKWTINGGTLTGTESAIEIRAGELTINGGMFTATATEYSCTPNGNGATTTGAAIAVVQHTTNTPIKVAINGGEFTAVRALNEVNIQENNPASVVTLSITGGTFNGEIYSEDVSAFITGGSFTSAVDAKYLGSDVAASITDEGITTYYTSLEDAIAAVTEGQTIVMLRDVTAGPGIGTFDKKDGTYEVNKKSMKITAGQSFTIDFNYHSYEVKEPAVGSSGTQNQAFHLEKGISITLKNGTLTVAAGTTNTRMVIQNYCDLTLESMTVDGTNLGLQNTSYYTMSNNNGTVLIKNSTITAKDGSVAFDVYSFSKYTGANVTVTDSTINGKIEVDYASGSNVSTLGLVINNSAVTGAISVNADLKEKVQIEAKIGNVYYKTLADAVSAALENGTITVLKYNVSCIRVTDKTVTFDGESMVHTLTYTAAVPATTTSAGQTAGCECSVCGYKVASKTIPQLTDTTVKKTEIGAVENVVEIDQTNIKSVTEAGLALEVTNDTVSVELPASVLTKVMGDKTGKFALSVEKLSEASIEGKLTEAQKTAVAKAEFVLDINLKVDTDVHELGGYVTVSLAQPEGKSWEGMYVAYIATDGTVQQIASKFVDGKVYFKTNHFSTFFGASLSENAVASVTDKDGYILYYDTMAAAVEAAQDGYMVEVLKSGVYVVDVGNKNLTFTGVEGTHVLIKTAVKTATSAEPGNQEYYTCSICKKVYKDDNATTETSVDAMTTYLVTFKNGDAVITETEYVSGAKITVPDNPTKTETAQYTYTFKGWSTGGSSVVSLTDATASGCVTYTALFESKPKSYNVTYQVDGVTVGEVETKEYDSEVTVREAATKEGYTFKSWSADKATITDGKFTMPAENVVLTAVFEINKCSISFNVDGGSEVTTITQDYNTEVTAPANPTKTGYTFQKWTLDGSDYTFSTMPAKNIELKAVWTINSHTVTYKVGDETIGNVDTVVYNTQVDVRAAHTMTGYTVSGWAAPEGLTVSADGKFAMPDYDVVFTATATVNTYDYTVRYVDGADKDLMTQATDKAEYGTTVTPEIKDIIGYTAPTATKTITISEDASKNVVVYVYTINTYKVTVSYVCSDGSEAPETQTVDVKYNEKYSVKSPAVTGYTAGKAEVSGTMGTENVTETVTYTPIDYTISFKNGDKVLQNTKFAYGTTPAYSGATPTKAADAQYSYEFKGWSPAIVSVTGEATYAAEFNRIAHEFTATYNWSSDLSSCTATKTCNCGYSSTETVKYVLNETDATCVAEGSKVYTAIFNDADFKEQTQTVKISAKGHSYGAYTYTWSEDNKSCTAVRSCTRDNCSGSETVKSTKVDSKVTTQPTCTEMGQTTYTAVFDVEGVSAEKTVTDVKALGHPYGEPEYDWNGYDACKAAKTCSACKDIVTEDAVITFKITSEATCTETGEKVYTATFKDADFKQQTETVKIPAKGHSMAYHKAVSHTCTTDGNVEYWYCETCKKNFADKDGTKTLETTVDPKTGHSMAYHKAVQPTCTKNGNVEYWACSNCSVNFSDEAGMKALDSSIAKKTGHTEKILDRKEPNCTETGFTEGKMCSVCNEILVAQETISAKGHSYGEIKYGWTGHTACTATRTCSDCDNVITENARISSEITRQPTCTAVGEVVYTATFDKEGYKTQTVTDTLAKVSHNLEKTSAKAATCTAVGNNDYWTCSSCGGVFSDENATKTTTVEAETIKMIDHTPTEVSSRPATCTEPGIVGGTVCSVCNKVLTGETTAPALGHKEVILEGKDATCTGSGLTEGKKCSVCNEILVAQEIIPAKGHSYEVKYEWTGLAACKATKTCSVCIYTVTVNAAISSEITTVATCTSDGVMTYTATFDDADLTKQTQTEKISAKGHTMTHHDAVAATCTKNGNVEYWDCSVCKKNFTDENGVNAIADVVTAKIGHYYGSVKYTWSDDHSLCTAERECLRSGCDGSESEEAVSSKKVTVATCLTDGSAVFTAEFENEVFITQTQTEKILAKGHSYEVKYEWTGFTACKATMICSACNDTVTDTGTVSSIVTLAATCTEEGVRTYTAVFTKDGFETQTKTESIAAKGHSLVDVAEDAKTCTTDGTKAHRHCSACGEDFIGGKIVTTEELKIAAGHTIIKVAHKDKTCTDDGNNAHYKCAVCGDLFTDAEGKTSTTVDAVKIGAKHELKLVSEVAKSCTVPGTKAHDKCSVCGKMFVNGVEKTAEELSIPSHTLNSVAEVAKTCTTDGTRAHQHCSECGKDFIRGSEVTKEQLTIPKGHTPTPVAATPATKEKDGLTAGSVCSKCNVDIVKQEKIEKLSSDATKTELKAAEGAVEVKSEDIKTVIDAGLGLEIKNDTVSVDIPKDVLNAVSQTQTSSEDKSFNLNIEKVTSDIGLDKLGDTTALAVKEAAAVISVDLTIGTTPVHELGNKVTVAMNYTVEEGKSADDLYVAYITPEGWMQIVECTYKDGKVFFETNHFSVYTLAYKSENTVAELSDGTSVYYADTLADAVEAASDGNTIKVLKTGVSCVDIGSKNLTFTGEAVLHSLRLVEAVDPTCNTAGHFHYYGCTTCGNLYSDAEAKTEITLDQVTLSAAHKLTLVEAKDATCKEGGNIAYYKCECGLIFSDAAGKTVINDGSEKIPAHTRTKVDAVSATCTEGGNKLYYRCSCGQYYDDADARTSRTAEEVMTGPAGHITVVDNAVPATCHSTGLEAGTHCSVCGKVLVAQNVTPKTTHTVVDDLEVPATCHKTGLTAGTHCSVCDEVLVAQKVTVKQHTVVNDAEVPATCHKTGLTAGTHCSDCGEVLTAQTVTVKKHTESIIVGVEPTCYKTGLTAGTYCSDCGEILTPQTVVNIKGHNPVKDEAVPATCTSTGLTAGSHCSDCGKVLIAQEIDPIKDHTEADIDAVEPTCYKTGLTAGKKCSDCGVITKAQETVGKVAHKEEILPAVEATCHSTGLSEGKYCVMCGKITVKQNVKEMTAHSEVDLPEVPATCHSEGLSAGKFCTVCGKITVKQNVVEMIDHREETIAAVEPTCTKTGLTAGKRCTVCGEITVKQDIVKMKGHQEETIPAVEATCHSTGLTAGKKCSECGEILKTQESVKMIGHKEEIIPAVAATCYKTGLSEGSRCSVCGEVIKTQNVEKMIDHKEVIIPAVAATCHSTGLTEGKFCTVCGKITVKQETVEKNTEHKEEVIPAVAATCYKTGLSEGLRCSVCGKITKTQTVENMVGHKEVVLSAVEATCHSTGLTEGKFCTVCGKTTVEQKVVEKKTTHTEDILPAVAATCHSEGLTEGKFCTICGKITVEQTTQSKIGHTEEILPAVAATCHSTGLTEGKFCTVCGKITVERTMIPVVDHRAVTDSAVTATVSYNGLTAGSHCADCGQVLVKQNVTDKLPADAKRTEVEAYSGSATVTNAEINSIIEDNLALAVSNETVSVELPASVLQNVTKDSDGAFNLNFAKLSDVSEIENSAIRDVVASSDAVISIDLLVGDKAVHELGDKVTVAFDYTVPEGKNASELYVAYIDESGNLEKVKSEYSNGVLSFETDHFSYYAVMYGAFEEESGLDDVLILGFFMTLMIVILVCAIGRAYIKRE